MFTVLEGAKGDTMFALGIFLHNLYYVEDIRVGLEIGSHLGFNEV